MHSLTSQGSGTTDPGRGPTSRAAQVAADRARTNPRQGGGQRSLALSPGSASPPPPGTRRLSRSHITQALSETMLSSRSSSTLLSASVLDKDDAAIPPRPRSARGHRPPDELGAVALLPPPLATDAGGARSPAGSALPGAPAQVMVCVSIRQTSMLVRQSSMASSVGSFHSCTPTVVVAGAPSPRVGRPHMVLPIGARVQQLPARVVELPTKFKIQNPQLLAASISSTPTSAAGLSELSSPSEAGSQSYVSCSPMFSSSRKFAARGAAAPVPSWAPPTAALDPEGIEALRRIRQSDSEIVDNMDELMKHLSAHGLRSAEEASDDGDSEEEEESSICAIVSGCRSWGRSSGESYMTVADFSQDEKLKRISL